MPTPSPPSLTYLYSCTVELGKPIVVGESHRGQRTIFPVTGGTFTGPKLSGKVRAIGADWYLFDGKGHGSPDSRYQLETDDGAHIFVQTSGTAHVDDGGYIIRVVLETGSDKYSWLNKAVVVGILKCKEDIVTVEMWQTDWPEGQGPAKKEGASS